MTPKRIGELRRASQRKLIMFLTGGIALGIPISVTLLFGDRTYTMVFASSPGVGTSILAVVLEVLVTGSALITSALLAYVAVAQHAGRRLETGSAQNRAIRWAEVSAPLWCASAFTLALVSSAEQNGLPASRVFTPLITELFRNTTSSQAWAIVAAAGASVWAIVLFSRRWWAFTVGWLVTIAASIPPVVTGQASVGAGHDWATDAAIFGAVAQAAALGLLLALPLLAPGGTGMLAPRHTLVLLGVMVASTATLGIFFSAGIRAETGWHVLLDAGKLLVIGSLVVIVLTRKTKSFNGTARVLFLLGGAAVIGLDAATARIPPPRFFVPQTIQENYLGYDLTDPINWWTLLAPARPNVLFLVLAVVAIAAYLAAVRRLRSRGDDWPRGRTAAWLAGWVVVLAATSTELGMYSAGMFSVHMIAHMALNMLGPVLLVMGGTVTLALRALPVASSGGRIGVREWIVEAMRHRVTRLATNPILVLVIFIASFYVLYFTPLFETAMRFHWGHQSMNVHFLLIGYLFYWQAIGVDRTPSPLPSVGKLGFVFAAMPFHAFFAIILMGSTEVIAGTFYSQLTVSWVTDRAADQYLGGGIAWAAGELPLLVVVLALGLQWAREDRRTATRSDRSEDAGHTNVLDDYNTMLARLSAGDATPTERTP